MPTKTPGAAVTAQAAAPRKRAARSGKTPTPVSGPPVPDGKLEQRPQVDAAAAPAAAPAPRAKARVTQAGQASGGARAAAPTARKRASTPKSGLAAAPERKSRVAASAAAQDSAADVRAAQARTAKTSAAETAAAGAPAAETPVSAAVPAPAVASPSAAVSATVEAPGSAGASTPVKAAAAKGRQRTKREAAALPPEADAQIELEQSADGGDVFGRYAVRLSGEEPATLWLRSSQPGTSVCSCLDFALSESADCPHLQALAAQIQADAARAATFAAGPQAPGSRVALRHGARRRLLWLPGVDCPAALDELARQRLSADAAPPDEAFVSRLLRAAREAGHELQVDEEVWSQLALVRDAGWRVERLEALFPQGPASAELQALVAAGDRPLLPLQVEGALFAVCAGRAILADAPPLQPMRQALAAALLWQRHFGLERVLVLAPRQELAAWQRALPADAGSWSLMPIETVAEDGQRQRLLDAELVIVHEAAHGAAGGDLWIDPERAAALLRLSAAQAIVLPAADWTQHPAEVPLRVAFVDAQRSGPFAALLQAHGTRDDSGALCGLHDLQALRQTLAPVLLARTLDEVRGELPERVETTLGVPMPAAVAAEHAAQCTALAAFVERWQRLGWMPDLKQRRLVAQVQALRRLCAGDGAPAVAEAKAAALQGLLDGGEVPVAKLVAFGQWPQALRAVRQALTAAGVDAACWCAEDAPPARQEALRRFHDEASCRVLLVADPGSGALELRVPQAQVAHLDAPWNPRVLSRRFGRVHRRGKAQLVPVTQLLLQDSFEQASLRLLAPRREVPVTDMLDAGAEHGFVHGEALAQWLADLAAALRGAMPPQAASEAAPELASEAAPTKASEAEDARP